MADSASVATTAPGKAKKYDDWEVKDAMHTMLRAGEIVKDKKLMGHVRKHAAEHAKKSHEVAHRASQLAKQGKISDKAMKKLDKTTPIA